MKKIYFVYIIRCEDNSLYTGITTDIRRRFYEHKSGNGGKYTRSHKVLEILYKEKLHSRSIALKREAEIKSWPRKKKIDLIKSLVA